MPRKSRITIRETIEELERLAKCDLSNSHRRIVEMLLIIKREPELTMAMLAERLGYSERMVRQWWRHYQQGRLSQILDGQKDFVRSLLFDLPEELSIPPGKKSTGAITWMLGTGASVRFSARSGQTEAWVNGQRKMLLGLLVDVDAVMINVRIPSTRDIQKTIAKTSSPATGGVVPIHRHIELFLDNIRQVGFPVDDYQVPDVIAFSQRNIYLGSIILWRRTDSSPIARETIGFVEGLRPMMMTVLLDQIRQYGVSRNVLDMPDRVIQLGAPSFAYRFDMNPRQRIILRLILMGQSTSTIANINLISTDAVRKYRTIILRKAKASNFRELMDLYFTPTITAGL